MNDDLATVGDGPTRVRVRGDLTFQRREDLVDILEANGPLVRARDLVLSGKAEPSELTALIEEARGHPFLHDNRQLSALLAVAERGQLDTPKDRAEMAYRLETVNLLGHVVTRTRKRDVKEWRVVREPIREAVRSPTWSASFIES